MEQTKHQTTNDTAVAPFAEATRTPVTHVSTDLSEAAAVPSPARLMQSNLEASLDGCSALPMDARYSPRMVTASVVTVCLAFWLALYLAAAAVL